MSCYFFGNSSYLFHKIILFSTLIFLFSHSVSLFLHTLFFSKTKLFMSFNMHPWFLSGIFFTAIILLVFSLRTFLLCAEIRQCFLLFRRLSSQPYEPVPFLTALIYINCRFRIDLIINKLPSVILNGNTYRFQISPVVITFSRWSVILLSILMLSYRTVYIKQYIGNTPFFILWLHYTSVMHINQ